MHRVLTASFAVLAMAVLSGAPARDQGPLAGLGGTIRRCRPHPSGRRRRHLAGELARARPRRISPTGWGRWSVGHAGPRRVLGRAAHGIAVGGLRAVVEQFERLPNVAAPACAAVRRRARASTARRSAAWRDRQRVAPTADRMRFART